MAGRLGAHLRVYNDQAIARLRAHLEGYSEAELDEHTPRVLYHAADGSLSHTSNAIPVQLA